MIIKGAPYLRTTANSKKPEDSHLMTDYDGDIYIVDSDGSSTVLLLTEDEGISWSSDGDFSGSSGYEYDSGQRILATYLDANDERLYVIVLGGGTLSCYYVDLTDHTVTDCGDIVAGRTILQYDADICVINDDVFVCYIDDDTLVSGNYLLRVYEWDGDATTTWTKRTEDAFANLIKIGFWVVVGTDGYIILDDGNDADFELWIYDQTGDTFTELNNLETSSFPSRDSQTIVYDGSNLLYMIVKKDGDGFDYLYKYSITGDTFTEISRMDNVVLMTQRNVASGSLPKAYNATNEALYEMDSKYRNLYKVWGFTDNNEPPATLLSLSENYIIDSGGKLYKYQNVNTSIIDCDIKYKMNNITTATLKTTYVYDDNSTIKVYDDSSVLCFVGYITEREYDYEGKVYRYKVISYDSEILTKKISYAPTAVALNTAVEAVLDNCAWLYYDGSIDVNATTITANFKNLSIKKIMETMADDGDFIWYTAPDGKVYYNDGTTDSGETISETAHIIGRVSVKDIQAQINYVKIYGGYANGVRLYGEAEDKPSQNAYGRMEYIDHYPHIIDQTQLNALAAAILARSGIADNPRYVYVPVTGVEFKQCGTTINFAFAPFGIVADDLLLLGNNYNAKNDEALLSLSTGIVQNWRGYGKTSGIKTQSADEEQLDVLAADLVNDTAYAAGWDGVTTVAPSKNVVYDKIEAVLGDVIIADNSPSGYTKVETSLFIMDEGYTVAQLQAAIDEAEGNSGGMILLPEGTCSITSQITITSAVSIIGMSKGGCIWDSQVATAIIDITGENARLENITMTFDATNDIGIDLSGGYSLLKNLYLKIDAEDTSADSIGIECSANYSDIEQCHIKNFDTGIVISGTFNHIANTLIYGGDIGYNISADHNTIIGCHTRNSDEYGVYCTGDRNTIIGCYLRATTDCVNFQAGADDNSAVACVFRDGGSTDGGAGNEIAHNTVA